MSFTPNIIQVSYNLSAVYRDITTEFEDPGSKGKMVASYLKPGDTLGVLFVKS